VLLSDAEMKTAGMALGRPEKGPSGNYMKTAGVIDVPPQNVVSVSFLVGGYLVSTRLMPGMRVRRGQAIAEMQDPSIIQMQQDYLVARSKAGFLEKEYQRQKLLNATKTTSDKVLEQTQSDFQTQRILMSSLREKLRLIKIDPAGLSESSIRRSVMIYSPIDAYVSSVNVNIGKYVNPSDVLFELVNPADIHLQLKVFEKDLPLIKQGQKVTATLVNNSEKTYDAVVRLVSRNLDNDRSATVHCHFTHGTTELLPGMFANATIQVATREAITVPEEAVVRWEEGQYIFVQKGAGKFEMTPVTTGSTKEGRTEVENVGINLTEQTIITKNAYSALMKLHNKAE
jgi:cobalt-zinc-cadmium efflux system membrane fusion protein